MIIQAVIFNWRGHEANAVKLQRQIRPLADVTVVNSDEDAAPRHPDWIHLNEEAYFSAQWNEALRRFNGEVLFHVQADAEIDDCALLFKKATACFQKPPIGVYEPYIDFTDITYDESRLPAIGDKLYRVPLTDSTCWFIGRSILNNFQPIDPAANRYGWGVPGVVAALGLLQGKFAVRDYSIKVRHPKRRGYATRDAMLHRKRYFQGLDIELQKRLQHVYRSWEAARPPPSLPSPHSR
jgi:hypothetical protein